MTNVVNSSIVNNQYLRYLLRQRLMKKSTENLIPNIIKLNV